MNSVQRTPRFRAAAIFAVALTTLAAGCGDNAESADAGHEHTVYEVPVGTAVPTVEIEVTADPVSGANLYVDVTNYDVAPEHASTEPVPGEGHFHLYVDGEKVARFYNQALHLGLEKGEHTVMVELNANNHAPYAVDGEPITAMKTVTIPAPADAHSHTAPVEAADPVPTIELSATTDPKSGWNLFVNVDNFTFAPRQAGFDTQDGHGHMHLYVDGMKVGRMYGPWWHLGGLEAGTHEVTVEATANNHAPLTSGGATISSSVTIEVSADQATSPKNGDAEDDMDHDMDDSGAVATLDIPAAQADHVVEVMVTDGAAHVADNRFEVNEGESVAIIVTADRADHVHVHGYEIFLPIDVDGRVEVVFAADESGLFEVELEDKGLFLFDILVK